MHRKTTALCAALVALGALAIAPAAASASTLKDTSGGKAVTVPAGAKIVGISTSVNIFRNAFIEVKCNEARITGKVTNAGNDTGGVVEVTNESATFDGSQSETKCDSNIGNASIDVTGLPWCLKAGGALVDNWTLTPADSCTGAGEFRFTVTALGTSCVYRRTVAISGTASTGGPSNSTLLSVTGEPEFAFVEGGFLCGGAPGKITQMAFNLYTDNGGFDESAPVWLSAT